MLIHLTRGDYRVVIDPPRGGSVARFDWRGKPVFRPTCGTSILDTSCFPLVPFSNRIAHGRFETANGSARLAPNFPGQEHPHPLHGFGWLSGWDVESATATRAVIVHNHAGGEWPWRYQAKQLFELLPDGLRHAVSLRNLSGERMFAGLGVHPYFPRTGRTLYRGLHRGEWQTAPDGLPIRLESKPEPVDWWNGQPVAARPVDTVYTDRRGPLVIHWPEREIELAIEPSPLLSFTVVYVPEGEDFFCVEPVNHATDAINRACPQKESLWLGPGEQVQASVLYRARHLPSPAA